MKTLTHFDKHPGRNHIWLPIGAHTLHAGHKPEGRLPYPNRRLPQREVRTVYKCIADCVVGTCSELKVDITHHLVLGQKETP